MEPQAYVMNPGDIVGGPDNVVGAVAGFGGPRKINGGMMATIASAVAAGAALPGALPGSSVLLRIDLAAGALATTNIILGVAFRVIDAFLILRGAGVATTLISVGNGATLITDAMAASGADKALVRAATIDDAAWEIAAGGTLRIVSTVGASQPACTVYVLGHLVP